MSSNCGFPETHYPRQTLPNACRKRVKLPDGYGCFHAADLSTDWKHQDDEAHERRFRFQYCHGNETGRLEADEPTMPLLQPQECSSIVSPDFQDLARMGVVNNALQIQDRAEEQAIYLYKRFPRLIWGSALDFLKDSYVDQIPWEKRKRRKFAKLQARNPIISLGKVRNAGNLPKLNEILGPALFDIEPNMLLSLLKEDINDSIHKQYVDKDFYGGCLAYQPVQPSSGCEGLLFHPTGPTLEVLNIHALPHQDIPIYSIKNSPSQRFAVSSSLRQIETVSVPYRECVLAGLRMDYACCIMKVTVNKNKINGQVSHLVHSQQKIASVALSPYLFGEYVLGLDTGGIQLVDLKNELKCVRESPELQHQSPCWCHYGGHPRQIVAHQRKRIDLVDCRAPAQNGNCCLLSLPTEDLPRNQEIYVARQHPGNHFYHFVATQNLLLLLDERYPKYNVLQWSHSLRTPPNSMDIVHQAVTSGGPTSDLIVLASQRSREVHCFQCNELNGQTPESTSLPWKTGSTDDWFNLLPEYPAVDLGPVRSRLESPLIGVSAAKRMPCAGCEPGVTVFQLSSAGDLFFQTYSHKTTDNRRDKTLSFGPGCPSVKLTQESLTNCKGWIEEVLHQAASETKQTSFGFKKVDVDLAMKIVTSMTSPSSPDIACRFCSPTDIQQQETRLSTDPSRPCPACGVAISDGRELKEHFEEGEGVLHKRADEDDDDDLSGRINPRRYQDEISKTLHRAWVHGYDDDADEEVEEDSSDQDMTVTPAHRNRKRRPPRTPELFTPSQKRQSQREECNDATDRHARTSRSLDMSEEQRAEDTQRAPKARLSQAKKKVKRTAMGF